MATDKILVIGANGQIGTVLCQALRDRYGIAQVIASDLHTPKTGTLVGTFDKLDVLDAKKLLEVVRKHKITQIYHLAAILSAKGEENPQGTWDINMRALLNVLEVARQEKVAKVYFPSSIAVFGDEANKTLAAQHGPLYPRTMYGITKAAGEQLCAYYHQHFGLDVRSLRYPGLIGYQSQPGGGTTDYAVDIFFQAAEKKAFSCFLREDTVLPMMYMDDAIRATLELMDAPAEQIKIRHSYNIQGLSFSPAQLAEAIQKHLPEFQVSYAPDHRQAIADSWVQSLDDQAAREDWGWSPRFDLEAMTEDMLKHLQRSRLHKQVYDERKYL